MCWSQFYFACLTFTNPSLPVFWDKISQPVSKSTTAKAWGLWLRCQTSFYLFTWSIHFILTETLGGVMVLFLFPETRTGTRDVQHLTGVHATAEWCSWDCADPASSQVVILTMVPPCLKPVPSSLGKWCLLPGERFLGYVGTRLHELCLFQNDNMADNFLFQPQLIATIIRWKTLMNLIGKDNRGENGWRIGSS